jgi:hypothetical protein
MSNPLEMMLIYCSFKGDDCFLALLWLRISQKGWKYPVFPNRQDSRRKHGLVLKLTWLLEWKHFIQNSIIKYNLKYNLQNPLYTSGYLRMFSLDAAVHWP